MNIEIFIKNIELFTVSIAPFAIGIFIAILIITLASKLSTNGNELKNLVYDCATFLSLSFLLPIHLFLTIISREASTLKTLFLMSILGVLICWIIFKYSKWIGKIKYFSPAFPHSRYLASTFGGGNRGIMMILAIVAFAPSAIPKNELPVLVDSFALLDAGYYFFFTMIIYPYCMPRDFSCSQKTLTGFKPSPYEFAIPISFLLALIPRLTGNETLQDLIGLDNLQESRRLTGYSIAVVSTTAIGIKFNWRKTLGGMKKLYASIFLSRILGIMTTFFLIWLAMPHLPSYAINEPNYIILIPLIVLIICPPSSLVDQMMKRSGANEKQIGDSATLSASWAFYFISLVFIIYFLAFLK